MILTQYGITLKRITKADIELIRTWRNHPDIRKRMAYRKKITAAQQEKWFDRVSDKLNYFFLISVQNQPIGVINCKEVNEKDRCGEGGIFIWDEAYRSTPYPVFASLILMDFIFNELEFGNLSFVRILQSNREAQAYNKQLGYVRVPGQEKEDNQLYVLAKETYNRKAKNLRKAAALYTETTGELIFKADVSTSNLKVVNDYIQDNDSFISKGN